MTLYKGNAKIRDEGLYGVYHGSDPIAAIYHGSDRVYMFNKSTTWQAGTTLAQYTVSPWCNKIRVDCVGSQGHNSYGGKGGRVQCVMTVTPNQVLYISVGAMDNDYNAADIRTNNSGLTNSTSLNSRLIVAGGGGRAGWNNGAGGAGGGTTGATGGTSWGDSYGGGGGTQSSGGAGGGHGNVFGEIGSAGSFGLGAKRSDGGSGTGSGGAGWYGGGSGGAGWYVPHESYRWAGGGGGSSYTNSSCSNVIHTQGYQNGAGYITITEIE